MKTLILRALLLGGVACLLCWVTPFRFAVGNQTLFLPVIAAELDSPQLQSDFGVGLYQRYHPVFLALVKVGAGTFDYEPFSRWLHYTQIFFLLITGAWLLARWMPFGKALPVCGSGLLLGFGLEGNRIFGRPYCEAASLAWPFLFLAWGFLFRRRIRISSLFFGVAVLLHIQLGLLGYALATFGVVFGQRDKRSKKIRSLWELSVWAIPMTLLSLLFYFPAHEPGMFGETWNQFLHLRLPHHYAIRPIPFLLVSAMLLCHGLWIRLLKSDSADRLIFLQMAALFVLCGLHYLDYSIVKWGLVTRLQPPRLSAIISFVEVAYFLAILSERLRKAWPGIGLLVLTSLAVYRHEAGIHGPVQREWMDVCYWVRENTDQSAVFIAPPYEEGFVWNARRRQVADFKTSPNSGTISFLKWKERIDAITHNSLDACQGFGCLRKVREGFHKLEEGELRAISKKYGSRYLLTEHPFTNFTPIYSNAKYYLYAVLAGPKTQMVPPALTSE
ncbi:MAG: hypothetical protein HYR96_01935 [Deltaproteobacteria bacterium]|nr:hypothetical protein [Deltaproteobacteria bacterium]MBI3295629.1 hypothetical protein [Deltaproteobacteria bacterium]